MRVDVPRYSQYLDVKNRFWQPRSCGIVALKMVLEYWHRAGKIAHSPSIPALNRAGHKLGAYIRNVGWSHVGLVRLARRYGMDGVKYDWSLLSGREALKKLPPLMRRGPVLASVWRYPKKRQGGHLVVLADVAGNRVYLLDPAATHKNEIARTVSRQEFVTEWKRHIIVLFPRLRKRGQVGRVEGAAAVV
jgi:ABC-type bacteriocin/lantibiotic exporter with double-glycine peptidase domain